MTQQQLLPQLLNEWLDLLESRHPTEIEFGLDRIGRVATQLGLLPLDPLGSHFISTKQIGAKQRATKPIAKKVITVAGTNGKGSCVAAIDSILRKAGYRVGTYTSPHLIDYNERICIDGAPVDDESICAAFEKIESARGDTSLSYFEFGTLAAFLVMAEHDLDVAILEVGLGGRLDAVNLIDSDVAVVTSIALDHQDWLGDDLNLIAAEKAAVGREGKPLIYGDETPIPGLLQTANQMKVKLLLNGPDFSLDQFGLAFDVINETHLPPISIVCALQAATLLNGLLLNSKLSTATMEKGLSEVRLQGRFQQLDVYGVKLILDVAHNPQAAGLLADRLHSLSGQVIAVAGMMKDKDIDGILEPMLPLVKSWYFCDIPGQERAERAQNIILLMYNTKLLEGSLISDILVAEEKSPVSAVKKALAAAKKGDTVVVFGSFFTVGPVLNWLEQLGHEKLENEKPENDPSDNKGAGSLSGE